MEQPVQTLKNHHKDTQNGWKEKIQQSYYRNQRHQNYCNNQTHQMDSQSHSSQIHRKGQTVRTGQIPSLIPTQPQARVQIHRDDRDAHDLPPNRCDDILNSGQY
mgnify:CR=1 FL=1